MPDSRRRRAMRLGPPLVVKISLIVGEAEERYVHKKRAWCDGAWTASTKVSKSRKAGPKVDTFGSQIDWFVFPLSSSSSPATPPLLVDISNPLATPTLTPSSLQLLGANPWPTAQASPPDALYL